VPPHLDAAFPAPAIGADGRPRLAEQPVQVVGIRPAKLDGVGVGIPDGAEHHGALTGLVVEVDRVTIAAPTLGGGGDPVRLDHIGHVQRDEVLAQDVLVQQPPAGAERAGQRRQGHDPWHVATPIALGVQDLFGRDRWMREGGIDGLPPAFGVQVGDERLAIVVGEHVEHDQDPRHLRDQLFDHRVAFDLPAVVPPAEIRLFVRRQSLLAELVLDKGGLTLDQRLEGDPRLGIPRGAAALRRGAIQAEAPVLNRVRDLVRQRQPLLDAQHAVVRHHEQLLFLRAVVAGDRRRLVFHRRAEEVDRGIQDVERDQDPCVVAGFVGRPVLLGRRFDLRPERAGVGQLESHRAGVAYTAQRLHLTLDDRHGGLGFRRHRREQPNVDRHERREREHGADDRDEDRRGEGLCQPRGQAGWLSPDDRGRWI